ncbi:hypothetical protein KX729_28935 [Rhizobium sp. XQZ8]|uniref:hypothetical protein n=1 Tax=Rhizobium populisoli TaxID=2859785 RepID=UPI001CA5DDE1|nr:hypothetical protein [Rhizobium populisoli]MBW6425447.1 hypothetical protein [Rhizobium populisoli]
MSDNDEKTVMTASGNKVDESLSTNPGRSRDMNSDQRRELEELRAELKYLRSAVRRPALARSTSSVAGVASVREEVEHQIRLQPIASVALAAVVGFVYGIAR